MKYYMNPYTGNVDTLEGWFPHTPENSTLIEVFKNDNDEWEEVK